MTDSLKFFRETLKDFDYFRHQKVNALTNSFSAMSLVVQHVNGFQSKASKSPSDLEESFTRILKVGTALHIVPHDHHSGNIFLQLDLWGNRCDLSISAGKEIKQSGNPFLQIDALNPFVLVDRSKDIWNCIISGGSNQTIDFILDNAGYELFTDLVLAGFLLDNQLASKIRFHIKAIPWFISDVNAFDFDWTIKTMAEHEDANLSGFGKKLDELKNAGKIVMIENEYFWTGPCEFYRMKDVDCKLYDDLSTSDLLIFKGDLNYRKLLGDFNWSFDSTFETVLRG